MTTKQPLVGTSPSEGDVKVPDIVMPDKQDPGSADPTTLPRQQYQEVPQALKDQLADTTPGQFSPIVQTELPAEDPLEFALPAVSDTQFTDGKQEVEADLAQEQQRFDSYWQPPEQSPILNYGLTNSDKQLQDYIAGQRSEALAWTPAELPFELGKKLTPLDPSVTGGFVPTSENKPFWGDLSPTTEWNPLQGKFGDFGKGLLPGLFQGFGALNAGSQGLASDVGRGFAALASGLEAVGAGKDFSNPFKNVLGLGQYFTPSGMLNAGKETLISAIKIGRNLPGFAKEFASTYSVLSPKATGQKPLTNLPANNLLQKLRNQSYTVSMLTGRNASASDKLVDDQGRFNPLGQQRASGKRTGPTLTRKLLGIPDDVVLDDEPEVGGFVRGLGIDLVSGEAFENLAFGIAGRAIKKVIPGKKTAPAIVSRPAKKTIDITSENPNGAGRRQLVDPKAPKGQKLLPPARPDRVFISSKNGVIEYTPLNPKKLDSINITKGTAIAGTPPRKALPAGKDRPQLPAGKTPKQISGVPQKVALPSAEVIPETRRLSASLDAILQPTPRLTVGRKAGEPIITKPGAQKSGETLITPPGAEAIQLPDVIKANEQPALPGVSPTTKLLPEADDRVRTLIVSEDGQGVYEVVRKQPKPDPIAKRIPKNLEDVGEAIPTVVRVIPETIPNVEILADVLEEIPFVRGASTRELAVEGTTEVGSKYRAALDEFGGATEADVLTRELPGSVDTPKPELLGTDPNLPQLPPTSSKPERTFINDPNKGFIDSPQGIKQRSNTEVVGQPDTAIKAEPVSGVPKKTTDIGEATRQFDYNPQGIRQTDEVVEGVPIGETPQYAARPKMRTPEDPALSTVDTNVDLWKPFTEAEVLNVQRPGRPPMSPQDDATVQALIAARYYQPKPGVVVSEVAEDAVEAREVLREAALSKTTTDVEAPVVTPVVESPVVSTVDAEVFAPQMSLSELAENISKQQAGAVYNTKMLQRQQRTLDSLVELAKRVTLPNGKPVIDPGTAKSTINTWTKFMAKIDSALNTGGLANDQVGMFRKVFARDGVPIPENFPKNMVVRVSAAKADGTPEVLAVVRQPDIPNIPLSEDYGVAMAVKFDKNAGRLVPVDNTSMKVFRATEDIKVVDRSSWFQKRAQELAAKGDVDPADLVEPDLVKDKEALVAYQADLPDELVGRTPDAAELTNARMLLQNEVGVNAQRMKAADVEYQKVSALLDEALAKLDDVPDAAPQTLLENPAQRMADDRPVVSIVPNEGVDKKLYTFSKEFADERDWSTTTFYATDVADGNVKLHGTGVADTPNFSQATIDDWIQDGTVKVTTADTYETTPYKGFGEEEVAAPTASAARTNETRLYHGSRVEGLDLTKIDPTEGGSRGELGTAIYLTRDVTEAEAKAVADVTRNIPPLDGRTFGSGAVHEVVLKPTARIVDSGDKLSASAVAYFQDSAYRYFGDTPEGAKAFRAYSNFLEKSSTTYLQAYTKLEEALLKASKSMYGEAAVDEKLLLSFQRDVNRALRDSGIDGITNGNTVAVFKGDALNNVSVTPWKDSDDTMQVAAARYNADSISAARTPTSTQLVASAEESKVRMLSELQEAAKRELDAASSELDDNLSRLLALDEELAGVVNTEKTQRIVTQKQSNEIAYKNQATELNKLSEGPCL